MQQLGTVIGVDCGRKSGGLVILRPDGSLRFVSMNSSFDLEQVIDELVLSALEDCAAPCVAFVEYPNTSRFTGKGADKTSMLQDPSLMINYGAVMAAMRVMRIPVQSVMPSSWQKPFELKGQQKDKAAEIAVGLFQARTHIDVDQKNADAFLIAEFGRRIACGERLVKSWRPFPADWKFSKYTKILSA